MTAFNLQAQQAIHRNFSSVVDFLDRKFHRSKIHLQELPSYMYKGSKSKLEITVFPHPKVAKIDVKIIGLRDYEREPAFESSYDLYGLSMAKFQRDIDDLISKMS